MYTISVSALSIYSSLYIYIYHTRLCALIERWCSRSSRDILEKLSNTRYHPLAISVAIARDRDPAYLFH